MSRLRVALIQLAADEDVAANVERAVALVRRAGESRPQLIALPEMFQYRGPGAGLRESATELPGAVTERFAELARALDAWILLGSLAERSTDPRRPYNTSVLLDPAGQISATYRKRHLFDVSIDGGPSDHESARTTPGDRSVVATMPGVAEEADVRIGLSVCFDLRFPEPTGRDHWEVLLRARAIENGAFVIAPAQCGVGGGVPAHGRSMVVDPWGVVIAQATDGPGVVVADLEMDRVVQVRRQLPTQPTR